MSVGYYLIHRDFWDDELFAKEPFTEREAWHWLIAQASFEPHRMRWDYDFITVDRGQIPTTYRKLKEAWGWSTDRIKRFLKLLVNDGKINTESGTRLTVITINNYNRFQRNEKTAGTLPGTVAGTEAGTLPGTYLSNTKQTKQKKTPKSPEGDSGKPDFVLPDWIPIKSWEAFVKMRKSKGQRTPFTDDARDLTIGKLEGFRSEGHDIASILDASVQSGWSGVFAPTEKTSNGKSSPQIPAIPPPGPERARWALHNDTRVKGSLKNIREGGNVIGESLRHLQTMLGDNWRQYV